MGKGVETRERILDRAFHLAGRQGLEGLSIGTLATDLGLSKSGLFAHFGSKEDLQIAVLSAAASRFEETVVRPALRCPRGEPRLVRWFDGWIRWLGDLTQAGGCIFIAAAAELDDQDGRTRDHLLATQRQLMASLARAAGQAVDAGQFRQDLDCEQFAFEFYAIILGCHHARRLLRDPTADDRAGAALKRLVASARRP